MQRRETIAGLIAVPVAAAVLSPSAAAATPTGKWRIALDGAVQPVAPRMGFNPLAGAYPGKLTRLPESDHPLVLGTYAGFTVTGHRS